MAALTFAEKIAQKYRLTVATPTVIDGSNVRDPATTETTAKTDSIAVQVANRIQGQLGNIGAYDDVDDTIGDAIALDFGVRLMLVSVLKVYSAGSDDSSRASEKAIMDEVKEIRAQRVTLAAVGKTADVFTSGTNLNNEFTPRTC